MHTETRAILVELEKVAEELHEHAQHALALEDRVGAAIVKLAELQGPVPDPAAFWEPLLEEARP